MTKLMTPLNAFDSLVNQMWRPASAYACEGGEATFRPRVDIHESETEFVIQADLPGVRKDDLQVEIEKGRLTISASRSDKVDEKLDTVHLERYASSRFVRSFSLGKDVNAEAIEGSLENGVLTLTVPKAEKALPRRIEVK